jgi:hypothetical protein
MIRYVATFEAAGATHFCGHVHRREALAHQCAGAIRARLPGARVMVAQTFDALGSPCPMRDFHQQGRMCPCCRRESA